MSDDLGFPHDHETIAWEHWLAQHIGKKNTEDFVRSFYGPLQKLDEVLNELYVERWLETADGDALDKIGCIVGLSRDIPDVIYKAFFGFVTQPSGRAFGVAKMRLHNEDYQDSMTLGDAEYRTALYLKIALNNGHGTAEEIMYAINTALNVTNSSVFDLSNATGMLLIRELILPTDPRAYVVDKLLPRAAGVKFYVLLADKQYVFGFSNQKIYYGFGVGIMARTIGSNFPYPIP